MDGREDFARVRWNHTSIDADCHLCTLCTILNTRQWWNTARHIDCCFTSAALISFDGVNGFRTNTDLDVFRPDVNFQKSSRLRVRLIKFKPAKKESLPNSASQKFNKLYCSPSFVFLSLRCFGSAWKFNT